MSHYQVWERVMVPKRDSAKTQLETIWEIYDLSSLLASFHLVYLHFPSHYMDLQKSELWQDNPLRLASGILYKYT